MSVDSIKTVAVLGSGTMGNGIAHVFARAGYDEAVETARAQGLNLPMVDL